MEPTTAAGNLGGATELGGSKKRYQAPELVLYGTVQALTASGTRSPVEGYGAGPYPLGPTSAPFCNATNTGAPHTNNKACSDRRAKENIVRIGTHPFGIGLYLFDYKPAYRDAWGHGRQFGPMADEVAAVLPEAVGQHPDGYKIVDYGMLGIARAVH